MPEDYQIALNKLKRILPFVNSVTLVDGRGELVYSIDNWNIKEDIVDLISLWSSMKRQPIMISGKKYLIRTCTSDRFVASSPKGEGHIVGANDDERTIITLIEPDGIIPFTTMEITRILASLKEKEPYLDESIQLGKNIKLMKDGSSHSEKVKQNKLDKDILPNQKQKEPKLDLPFTARLMAYYRAQESKRDDALIIDPFAERLAGNLGSYLSDHIRFSEMDYPLVRSYYIEKNLLTPWCNKQKDSQIVLLGAGLDTRAYRFKPEHKNKHTLFEIDFPEVIQYKNEILKNEKPFCNLVRLSADLSKLNWLPFLINSKFSTKTPTFWVLEGIAYYIEKQDFTSLLFKIAEISTKHSQIFIDIMQLSRWYSFPYTSDGIVGDPFSKHFKWGIDINSAQSLFAEFGWNVTCSFADDHDQGRNVGQKGMIFVHGERASTMFF